MQRILSRGEIESLDRTLIPRVLLPEPRAVFSDRAARLRQLANDSPIQAYLRMMASVCDAQNEIVRAYSVPEAQQERLELAQAHGMPPLQAVGWTRDEVWYAMLQALLGHLLNADHMPEQARSVCDRVLVQLAQGRDSVDAQADALLARLEVTDLAAAPFIMAALQVYWTAMTGQFDLADLPVVLPFGVCAVCGSLPVSSIVRIGGASAGCRYLCCPLCASERHLVRVTCSHCEQTEKIAYHSIDDTKSAIKAESCDHCHSYRKIFYQDKDHLVDSVADDLASLQLDILMGEEGYQRISSNPFLYA